MAPSAIGFAATAGNPRQPGRQQSVSSVSTGKRGRQRDSDSRQAPSRNINPVKTKSLIDVVRRFPECRTAVVGDLMLDRYIWGDATRISQEAPVPVVTVNRESEAPGGAANVATNIRTLGGQAAVYGIIGDDTCG
ncbi:MAG: hypothetical protein K9N51_06240, partial [Candidatus Pacebacteria bacterium]|nr:hypothetical protein [Candidatus Paceibacterota bacterium]